MSVIWKVRLADQAELDLLEITLWTAENFGSRQADVYAETLTLAIEALHDGPDILGVKNGKKSDPTSTPCMWRVLVVKGGSLWCSGLPHANDRCASVAA